MGKSILGGKLPVLLSQIEEIKPQTYIEIGCFQCETMHGVALAMKISGLPWRVVGLETARYDY